MSNETEITSPGKLSRRDIQNSLMPVVRKAITDLGIELKSLTNKPTERVIRAMLRAAARLHIEAHGKHDNFLGMAMTAFGDELYKQNHPKKDESATLEATEGVTEDPTEAEASLPFGRAGEDSGERC